MAERDTATAADRLDSDIVAKLNFRKPTTTCRCGKIRHRPHAGPFVDRLYRKNVAGVWVPSRFYYLLAIRRLALKRMLKLHWLFWKTGSVGS